MMVSNQALLMWFLEDLNLLDIWAIIWGMRFNAVRCNIDRTSILEEVVDAKYFVFTYSNDLEWSKHIATMTNKASSKH